MINLLIEVNDPQGAMSLYDTVRVYSDMDPTGAFTNLLTSIQLVQTQTTYTYMHDVNTDTWYEVCYYDTADSTESLRTGPVEGLLQGGPDIYTKGPLGVLTIAYVKNMTTFAPIGALDDAQLAELIIRAETILANYAARYGGWNTGYPNFEILQRIVARLLLEEIWLRSSQTIRAANAGGFIMEQMGAYQYRRGWPPATTGQNATNPLWAYLGPEEQKLLADLVNVSPTQIFFTTTQVFPELVPKQNTDKLYIRPEWDGWERERYWSQRLYEFLPAESFDKPTYLRMPVLAGGVQG